MNATEASNYKISVMSKDEISTAINWARNEGWNPGIHDAAAFYQAVPTGFLAGKYNDQIIATISAVKYGSHFGFIGLYIVMNGFICTTIFLIKALKPVIPAQAGIQTRFVTKGPSIFRKLSSSFYPWCTHRATIRNFRIGASNKFTAIPL
jgi:hypothetical protein